jgi:hypothetical protein
MLLGIRDRLLNLPGETAYMLAMRPQAECFELLDDAVRAALEEIADPAGTAARAAAAGIESKNGGPAQEYDNDSEAEDYAPDAT